MRRRDLDEPVPPLADVRPLADQAPAKPEPGPGAREGDGRRSRIGSLRSTLGVALLPCALAATLAWLALLMWGAFVLVDLPFR